MPDGARHLAARAQRPAQQNRRAAAISTDSSVLDQHTIYHDGKYYRYKDGLVNLLFIGVDSDEKPLSPLPYGNDNQQDVVLGSPCSIRTAMR